MTNLSATGRSHLVKAVEPGNLATIQRSRQKNTPKILQI
ncbi:MAG: hypothetical protein GQF41_4306 [Candidatus Rifleibacterium amylolyticum]|nr:MAG: hypothetical protein GQF41_4306 [Candidatus Rifleibacterium amylolyticum]